MKERIKIVLVIFWFILIPLYPSISKNQKANSIWDIIMQHQSIINIQKGIKYISENEYSKASIEFLKSIEKNPSSMGYTFYGASLYWMGDNKGALESYHKAIEMDPENDIAWQLKGISEAKEGNLNEALNSFLKAYEINPKRSDIPMNIGSVYFSLNNITKALEYLKKAINIDKTNPLYYYQLGLIYFYSEDFENAIINFQKAKDLKTDYEEAILWLAITYEKINKITDAIPLYKRAIAIKPYDFFARYRLARLLSKKEERNKIIIPCFELIPQKNLNTLGLQISYSAKTFEKEYKTNPLIKTVSDLILSLKENEEAYINIDIMEIENFTFENIY